MSSGRVVDVGAGYTPDTRATETADMHDLPGVDHQFDIRAAWPFDDDALAGVVMSHVLEHVTDQAAVLREAARCIQPGGWLEVEVPVGADAFADPDHDSVWTYATPAIFCSERRTRHWDAELPLRLLDRDATVRLYGPWQRLTPLLQLAASAWPAEAVRRCSSGALTARYEVLDG